MYLVDYRTFNIRNDSYKSKKRTPVVFLSSYHYLSKCLWQYIGQQSTFGWRGVACVHCILEIEQFVHRLSGISALSPSYNVNTGSDIVELKVGRTFDWKDYKIFKQLQLKCIPFFFLHASQAPCNRLLLGGGEGSFSAMIFMGKVWKSRVAIFDL